MRPFLLTLFTIAAMFPVYDRRKYYDCAEVSGVAWRTNWLANRTLVCGLVSDGIVEASDYFEVDGIVIKGQ